MDYKIRKLKKDEVRILEIFLYEAIFISEGVEPPPKDIINHPDLNIYISDFGGKTDLCYVAEVSKKIVGAAWTRIINDYGHIDDEMPSLSISLLKEFRNQGIGTTMVKQILKKLKEQGYKQVSLSVQKKNYAFNMYKNVGFEIVRENKEDYSMVCRL